MPQTPAPTKAVDFNTLQARYDLRQCIRQLAPTPERADQILTETSTGLPDQCRHSMWSMALEEETVLFATAAILLHHLSTRVLDPDLPDLWSLQQTQIETAPAPIAAALQNGFLRLLDMRLMPETLRLAPRLTRDNNAVKTQLLPIARSLTPTSIDLISKADCGMKHAIHKAALSTMIATDDFTLPPRWAPPTVVVKLSSYRPETRAGSACLAILLLNCLEGYDDNPNFYYEADWKSFHTMPTGPAFLIAFRYFYERGCFSYCDAPSNSFDCCIPWVA